MRKFLTIVLGIIFFSLALNAEILRIEIEDLSNNLSKYKIVDARKHEFYLKSHLPNAVNFPADFTFEDESSNGQIIQPAKMQKKLRELGLDVNDQIVIYGGGVFLDAPRMFWALEVYGFKNVYLLNGNYKLWKELHLPLTSKISKIEKSHYIATVNNKHLATKFTTQIATKHPNYQIIDARNYEEYVGNASTAKRFGHIPKALHIYGMNNINKSERLKAKDKLQTLYTAVDKDKKIVIYCSLGRKAAINYFALRELGYDVANYDGAWNEWGNDFTLPIEKK